VFNPIDPVNAGPFGFVWGAQNERAFDLKFHSTKGAVASKVLNDALRVQFDHGGSRYLPVLVR